MSSVGQVPRPSRRRAPQRDGGFTFVETVLTVVLLGIVVVPVLAAVRGAIRVSTVSQAAAQVETVLVNAADLVQRAPAGCDYTVNAQGAAAAMQWDPAQIAVDQEYLDPNVGWTRGPDAPLGYGPACPESGDQLGLATRITITVASPDGLVRRHMQVVKSDV
jgi:type II secretory pathway pseudopilin PulG